MTQLIPLQDNREFKILDILDGRCANVNRTDKIFLVAFMSMGGSLQTDITVVIKNEGVLLKAVPPVSEGYDASMFCGRFTDKPLEQVLLSFQSANAAQMHHYLFDFYNPQINMLLDIKNLNLQSLYTTDFIDGYAVVVTNVQTQEKHIIDLKYKPKVYISSLYDENGNLKKNVSGEILPIGELHPVYSDYQMRYQLLAFQKIAGINHLDILGFLITRLNWNGYEFQTVDVSTAILPYKK